MTRFDITFSFDGIIQYKIDEKILSYLDLHFEQDKSRFQTSAKITVEASDDGAILVARRKLEVFFGLYNIYSTDAIQFSGGHQVEIKNLDTNQRRYTTTLKMMPGKEFDQENFNAIITGYTPLILDPKNEYLGIALDYFRLAVLDNRSSNKIINYFVALEAMYSKNEETTEMRYRFSNRIATMLGKSTLDRKDILQKARVLYDKRSKVVHGSISDLEAEDLSRLYAWVRESIVRFLVLAKSRPNHAVIVDEIDMAMLDNPLRDKMRDESEALTGLVLN